MDYSWDEVYHSIRLMDGVRAKILFAQDHTVRTTVDLFEHELRVSIMYVTGTKMNDCKHTNEEGGGH